MQKAIEMIKAFIAALAVSLMLTSSVMPQIERPIEHREMFDLASDRVVSRVPLRGQDKDGAALARRAELTSARESPFYNGVAMSNTLNGYIEDSSRFVRPYIFALGARSIRLPLKSKNMIVDGEVADAVMINGFMTPQKAPLKRIIDLALANGVLPVLDHHEYRKLSDPAVAAFWLPIGRWLVSTYGPDADIVLELQNETNKAAWDPDYANSVKALVQTIRAAGIRYRLAIGWGGWNSVKGFPRAMADLDAIGGPQAIDPLNRLIWTAHFYQTVTGNDQPAPGRSRPEIKGSAVDPAFRVYFDGCKARALKCMITEMGMGGGARGWLANGSGDPEFNGQAFLSEFSALQAKYPGTVLGTIAWGGGSAWPDTYPLKIEYAKDAWGETSSTEYFTDLKKFMGMQAN